MNYNDDLYKESILTAREQRYNEWIELRASFPEATIVTIKANTPGLDKNLEESIKIVHYFDEWIDSLFDVVVSIELPSIDGLTIFKVLNEQDSYKIKKELLFVEDQHPIGRYIDLDVYSKTSSISRTELGFTTRKCYLCEKDARVCNREGNHSINELLTKYTEDINQYFISKYIADLAFESLLVEVMVYPKFGLVSPIDSGIHQDMDFYTFIQSAITLRSFFLDYGLASYDINDLNALTGELRRIGIIAEGGMFHSTNQVNTHKGANFLFGFTIAGIILALKNKDSFSSISKYISYLGKDLLSELMRIEQPNTHGERIYKEHQLYGVRGEIHNGLNLVFLDILKFYSEQQGNLQHNLVQTFFYIMSKLDDTTILHRHDMSVLKEVQMDMKRLLDMNGIQSIEGKALYVDLANKYNQWNISPGGSADLLAITYFLSKIKLLFVQE